MDKLAKIKTDFRARGDKNDKLGVFLGRLKSDKV